jgi:hypothetical protein
LWFNQDSIEAFGRSGGGGGLLVERHQGVVISPGNVKRIVREEMLLPICPTEKGDHFVRFDIEFAEDHWTNDASLKVIFH